MTIAPEETARLLRQAAAHARETGLWRGTYFPDIDTGVLLFGTSDRNKVPACAIGHMMIVSNERYWTGSRVEAMMLALRNEIAPEARKRGAEYESDSYLTVVHWSDARERTAEQVAEKMEAAADRLMANTTERTRENV